MGSINFTDFTPDQQKLIDTYLENNMYELNKIITKLINRKNESQMYDDDLHDVATKTFFESVKSYDESNGCKFKAYLTKCIWKAFYDWTRDNFYRAKRNNLQVDKKGKILKDEKGNPIIAQSLSMDEKVGNDLEWSKKIASDFKIEDNLSQELCLSTDDYSPKMKEYLGKLSKVQVKVLELLKDGYSKEEIENILHIDSSLYNDSIVAIRSEKNRRCIRSLLGGQKQC